MSVSIGVNGSPAVQLVQSSLAQGIVPGLNDIVSLLPSNSDAQIYNSITALLGSSGASGANARAQEVALLGQLQQLNANAGPQGAIGGNTASGNVLQLQAKQSAVQQFKGSLKLQQENSLGNDNAFVLPTVPAGTKVEDGSALLSFVKNNVQQGVIPSLSNMTALMPGLDPGSAQAQQINADLVQLLQQAGTPASPRIQEISAMMALRQLQNTTGSLQNASARVTPGSPEAQQLQARLAALTQLQSGLQNQFQQALSSDPAHGAAIQYAPPPAKSITGGGASGLFGMFNRMLQMVSDK